MIFFHWKMFDYEFDNLEMTINELILILSTKVVPIIMILKNPKVRFLLSFPLTIL